MTTTRQPLTIITRQYILERSGGQCGICAEPVTFEQLALDHVIPLARGGPDNLDNLQATHRYCNARKHTRLQGEPAKSSRAAHKKRYVCVICGESRLPHYRYCSWDCERVGYRQKLRLRFALCAACGNAATEDSWAFGYCNRECYDRGVKTHSNDEKRRFALAFNDAYRKRTRPSSKDQRDQPDAR